MGAENLDEELRLIALVDESSNFLSFLAVDWRDILLMFRVNIGQRGDYGAHS